MNTLLDRETQGLVKDLRGFQTTLSAEERVWLWVLLTTGYCVDCGAETENCRCGEAGEERVPLS